jgi:hypothetical protein
MLLDVIASSRRRVKSYRDEVLADNPVAYWRLGETSGTTAVDEMGMYDGTYVGSPTLGQAGAVGPAPVFDGVDDEVSLLPFGISGNTPRTIEAWIKPGSAAGIRCIVYTGSTGSGARARFSVYFNVQVANNIYLLTDSADYHTSANSITRDVWSHLAVSYDGSGITSGVGSSIKIYINGSSMSLTRLGTSTGDLVTPSAGGSIGRDLSSAGRFFEGSIDEVAIYNTALSAARIAAHYDARNNA